MPLFLSFPWNLYSQKLEGAVFQSYYVTGFQPSDDGIFIISTSIFPSYLPCPQKRKNKCKFFFDLYVENRLLGCIALSLQFGSCWRSGDSKCVTLQAEFTFQKEALIMTLVRTLGQHFPLCSHLGEKKGAETQPVCCSRKRRR